eukprot:15434624-Alexandrium_andersonii.AAC.1
MLAGSVGSANPDAQAEAGLELAVPGPASWIPPDDALAELQDLVGVRVPREHREAGPPVLVLLVDGEQPARLSRQPREPMAVDRRLHPVALVEGQLHDADLRLDLG